MPLLMLKTSATIPPAEKDSLVAALSKMLADATGKPQKYAMVTVEEVAGSMGGKPDPMAFADVRAIGGLTREVNSKIAASLCRILEEKLHLSPASVYVTFSDVQASAWGWQGGLFFG